jgi:hypothetical protein
LNPDQACNTERGVTKLASFQLVDERMGVLQFRSFNFCFNSCELTDRFSLGTVYERLDFKGGFNEASMVCNFTFGSQL